MTPLQMSLSKLKNLKKDRHRRCTDSQPGDRDLLTEETLEALSRVTVLSL